MSALANMSHLTLIVLLVVFFYLAFAQTVHAILVTLRRGAKPTWAIAVYEGLIAFHLALGCFGACAAAMNYGDFLVRLRPIDVPLEPLLWVNAALVALGAYLCVSKREPVMVSELALFALCTPAVVAAAGPCAGALFVADAAFFVFRVTAALLLDARHFATSCSMLSVIDAMDRLPDGIVWANKRRRILFMNDTMRDHLTQLGFATDLSETSSLWTDLEHLGRGEGCAVLPEGIRLAMPDGRSVLFSHDTVRLRGMECYRMVSVDVTEEEALNAQLEAANELLEAENAELRESMTRIDKVARDEALLRMKARVHDTIGQRLSILHRFLEAENPTPAALDEVTRLAGSILDDLAEPSRPDRASELASIARAFSLIGIDVHVAGTLPADAACAEVFVRIVREAATNAAKHAQASRVDVQMVKSGEAYVLLVQNDGIPPAADIREGTGIPGMRRAAAQVGATFNVTRRDPFTIEVVAPARLESGENFSPTGPAADPAGHPANYPTNRSTSPNPID